MRGRWYTLALFLLALPLLGCSMATASYDPPAFSGWTKIPVDYQGFRFVDKTKDGSPVAVPGLVPECAVRFEQGKSLPAELENRLVLQQEDVRRPVLGPADLAGCVRLTTPGQALEYLRLFSSFDTSHLFCNPVLEIFEERSECLGVCLPSAQWKKLHLRPPAIRETSDGFEVSRYVIRPERWSASLFRRTEKVFTDGAVRLIREEYVPVPPEDLEGLFFPAYL